MAEHFKLEITNRSTKITTWTGVPQDFAEEYRQNLVSDDSLPDDYVPAPMTDAMKTVLTTVSTTADDKPINVVAVSKKCTGKYATYNYAKRVKQRRSTFKTLAYINFKIPNVQFVTLTFDNRIVNEASDLKSCHMYFRKFIKRIRHQYDDFRYLAVFSKQTNKNWHYHMICNFDETVSGKTIRELWSYGIIHNTVITKYDEFDTKISYCIDNMEQVAWDELQSEKGYLCSKGLQNKIVLRSWNDNEADMAFEYLHEILGSTDKPIPISSTEILEMLSDYEIQRMKDSKSGDEISSARSFNINYLISHKGFAELFEMPVVAKRKC